jgi:hypothetical protein
VRPLSRFDATLPNSPAVGVRLCGRSSLPAGWRPEDLLRLRRPDDFLPALEAATRMGLSFAEVEGLAVEGWLDAYVRGGELRVRPVVLSRLRVRDERVPAEPTTSAVVPDRRDDADPPADLDGLERFGRVEP